MVEMEKRRQEQAKVQQLTEGSANKKQPNTDLKNTKPTTMINIATG
jgi:hypothetical protein